MVDYLQRAKYFKTKKRLGQNFLIDADIISNIIEFADIQHNDTVLEIGPGVGFVTEQLIKYAKKVIAVELDEEAIWELKKLNAPNLEIIHADILKTDISSLLGNDDTCKLKVVANIPYYITSPIIAHLLGEIDDLENKNRSVIKDIILMVQEEVARRIVATEKSSNKQYGLLTILSQFWADCSIIKYVGRRSFYPAPKVNSALVSMKVRQEPLLQLKDYTFFRKIIKASFSQRRKTLKNCLLNASFNKDKITFAIKELGFDENIRGEKLSIKQYGELSEQLYS